jgi:hypothetical protein
MILSCHQAQYLPWLGYFDKIKKSDVFVFLDKVQYKKREYQNRNRIKTANGPQWLTVPVETKNKYEQFLHEVSIDTERDWRASHLKALEINYHKADYFGGVFGYFEDIYGRDWRRLIDLNKEIISFLLRYLKIEVPVKGELDLDTSETGTRRIIEICRKAGADTYLSGIGGKDYLEEELFEENGINLIYQDFEHPVYKQLYGDFIPYMSAVDMIFNCGEGGADMLGKKGGRP